MQSRSFAFICVHLRFLLLLAFKQLLTLFTLWLQTAGKQHRISVKMRGFSVNGLLMTRTRVKICGITRPEDGQTAARLGVDAIGLVFYPKSPRNISIEQAREICDGLPAFVSVVSLFMNPDASLVESVLEACPIDLLQFHGSEEPAFCEGFERPYIKALGVAGEQSLPDLMARYASSRGILLDSHGAGAAGGTGETFDWSIIPPASRESIILAGGLKPANVAEAIQRVRPYAVDLSSGVESSPGVKDPALIAQLMNEVKRIDCEQSE